MKLGIKDFIIIKQHIVNVDKIIMDSAKSYKQWFQVIGLEIQNLPKLPIGHVGEHDGVIHTNGDQLSICNHHVLDLVLMAGSREPIIVSSSRIPVIFAQVRKSKTPLIKFSLFPRFHKRNQFRYLNLDLKPLLSIA